MIYVIATIDLQPGTREAFLAEFRQVVPKVLAETGCLEYGPAVDLETNLDLQPPVRPDAVTVLEKWDDLPSLEAHLVAPHMQAYRQRVKSLVRGASVQVLRPA